MLMTQRLRSDGEEGPDSYYGDFTDFGYYGRSFTSFDKVLEHDASNGTFGIITYSDEVYSSMGQNHTVTFRFSDTDIPLSKNQTYYVYLWTQYRGHCFPDNLFAVIKVQDGAVQYTEPTGRNSYDDSDFEFVKAAEKYSVTVTPAANMTKTAESGAESQTDLDVPMTDVVYTADTDVTDWVPPATYDILVAGSEKGTAETSISKTIAGDIVTVTVTPAEGQLCTGIEVKTASGKDVPVTPVSRATSGNQWSFVMPAENVTVVAAYEAQTPVYKVTYMADGKQVGEIQNVESGKDATAPVVPEKEGYNGTWDKDGKNITADTVINAVYTVKTYTVTYKADGNTVGNPQTVEHGKNATAPAVPAKEGYNGTWDKDGKNITADTVINAVYTVKTYTVTYKADGNTVGNPQTVEHGKNATAPAVPAKEGYNGAWDKDGKNITADTEINAVYTIKTYTVTFKADGKVVDTQTVPHGGSANPPKIPEKTGYSGKWSYETRNVTSDMTIEAVYSTNPFTGDNSHIYGMGLLMVVSLCAAMFLLVYGKSLLYRGKYVR